jgi:hypothetical protein
MDVILVRWCFIGVMSMTCILDMHWYAGSPQKTSLTREQSFTQGLHQADFVKEMGRIKPKIVAKLMDVANRFADGEDAYQNKRTRSPKDDKSNRYNNQRQRSCNYDNYDSHSQVAAGYRENNYDRQNSGYRNDNRKYSGSNKQFRPRVQENTISRQTICSMDHATCTTRMSTEKEFHDMQ